MSGYEGAYTFLNSYIAPLTLSAEDHNLPAYSNARPRQPQAGRPDYSTFYNTLAMTDTANTHTEPLPQDVSAVYRLLANTFQIQLGENEGVATLPATNNIQTPAETQERIESMIEALMAQADNPPKQVQGLPDEWFDRELERVPNKSLKKGDRCALCFTPYLDDKYPLVVRLPCHDSHIFDLECLRPWLKVNTTCPFCRFELAKKKEAKVVARVQEEDGEVEDEFDGLYA